MASARTPPMVGVVVLNWNSAWFTRRCLQSLGNQTHPADRTRIVLVDNGSVDGSLVELRHWLQCSDAPPVEVLATGENLGFAEGCNRAIRMLTDPGTAGSVEYVALLNNDAWADPGWLAALVAAMQGDDRCAAVSSRLVLEPEFAPVELTARESPLTVTSLVLTIDGSASLDVLSRVRTEGFTDEGALDWPARKVWRLAPHTEGRLWVPCSRRPARVSVGLIDGAGSSTHLDAVLPEERTTLLNGLGTGINDSGEGFDILYGEPDRFGEPGVPGTSHEVDGFCGGAALLRADALAEVGLFDPAFFAYYEDTDLSWRMRRAGWKVLAEPAALAHHAFGASGGGGSRWHVFLDRRNWLVTNLRNGNRRERARALGWLSRGGRRLFRVNVFGRVRRGHRAQAEPLATWVRATIAAMLRAPAARRATRPGQKPTRRVRGVFQPAGSPKAPEPWPGGPLVVYIDVGETLKAGYRAGIQRVVCALAAELPSGDERLEVVLVRWCPRNRRFRRITAEEHASLLRSGGGPDLPDSDGPVERLKSLLRWVSERTGVIATLRHWREQVFGARRRRVEDSLLIDGFTPGSLLFECDAVWNELEVDRDALLADARRRGVIVASFVHDLLPLQHPDWFAPRLRRIFDPVALAQLRHSDSLLCASSETAGQVREVCEQWSIPVPPIEMVSLGVAAEQQAPDADCPPAPLEQGRYLLVVGTLEPRKNHAVVLDALDLLPKSHRDLQMVFAGRYGWGSDALVARIRSHPDLGRRLHWFDDAHDEVLATLYRGAAAVLVPSHSEGFGLPALEALGHGTPVVASSGGALPEVLSDVPAGAVRFADPSSPQAWATAVEELTADPDTLAAARAAAAAFTPRTWGESAEGFAGALLRAAQR